MATLRDLQADTLEALFERSDVATKHVRRNGLSPARRLAIYRNNLFGSLTDALAAVYPTVAALVGDGFFRLLAHACIVAHPSRSGNLHEFGAELPQFLETFEPARSLPYLTDSARLDWAWHAVFHTPSLSAPDAAGVLAQIATMTHANRLDVRMRWQPAARLVASSWPILRIWQVHQAPLSDDNGEPLVDLDEGGEAVLVIQRGGEVTVERLMPAEHALLAALSRGAGLGDAVAAALTMEPEFDVASALAHHSSLGTLVGLESSA